MSGDSIKEAKSALEISLRALPEGACFNIYRFGSNYQSLYKESMELAEAGLREALAYLKNTEADLGGTELLAPLQAILNTPLKKAGRSILLITDGEIGNEEEILRLMDQHRASTRLFTLGIGAGPNEYLVKALSRTGSGAFEFIFPGERIEPKVLRVFEKLLRKGISDPVIQWGTGVIQAPEFSILFPGYPATFFAKLGKGTFPDKVRLEGKMDGKPVAWEVEVILCDGLALPIPVLWARERIHDLEGKMSGRGAHQKEGKADEVRDFFKQKVIAVSRAYGLLSQETDFVAVEERAEADRTVEEVAVRKVPALVTAGWHGINVLRDVSVSFCISAEKDSEPEYYFSEVAFDTTIEAVSKIGLDEDDIILTVLKQQQMACGFLLDKSTAKLLGLDLKALAKLAGKITTSGEVDRLLLLSTALVLHILETRYADRRSLWEGVVKKSVAWLREQIARTNPVLEGRELKAWVVDFPKEGKSDD
jgi:Ca-activated chloride channel family protein